MEFFYGWIKMPKLDEFKQVALGQGFSEDEVNSFIEMASLSQPTPSADKTIVQSFEQPSGYNKVGIEDEKQQMSRYTTPEERSGYNRVGVEDEEKQMSRYTTPQEQKDIFGSQGSVLPQKYNVTQPFGNKSSVEKFSGGVNLGTDFAVPQNTPLSAPPGEWTVVTASPGFNQGSGNFVKLKNTQTGETIGFEHLSKIGVQPGAKISGGTVIGLSGGGQDGPGRGNSTGNHASIPYQDANGNYRDVLNSPYGEYIYGS